MRKTKFFGLLLTFFLLIGISVGVSAAFGEVNVTVSYNVDLVDGEPITIPQAHGALFTHEAPADHGLGKIFKYWVVNGILRQDLNKVINIITRSSLNLKAVYGQEGKHIVTFIDSNGAYLKHEFVDGGSIATAPTAPNKPQAVFSGFVGLGTTANVSDPITMDTVFVATYTTSTVAGSLTVDGIVKPEVTINDLVTLEAPANFSHWVDGEGNILSYDPNYKFTMLVEDRIVNPVLGTPEVKPLVNMIAEPNLRDGYTSYVGQFEMPEGYELVEYGFIISRSLDALTVDSLGATIIPSNVYNEQTNEFLRSFPEDSYNSIRAYAIFAGGVTVYSDYSYGSPTGTYATDLFISEYIEGSSNNKAIEIYNGTGSPVNLSGYNLKVYVNDATTPGSAINLSGTLNPGEVYVVVNPSANATILAAADMTSGSLSHNGNDAIGLFEETTLIDIVGTTGTTADFAKDKTLVRKASITTPKTTWDSAEWDSYPKDTIEHLGLHTSNVFFVEHEIVYNNEGVVTKDFVIDGSLIQDVSKEGYTFDGWFLEDTFETEFTGEVKQSLKLYAKFTIKSVTLTFDTDGGSLVDSITQNYGTEVTAPADPIKEGYTFVGWTPAIPLTMPAENQTFKAVWEANQYTVTFVTDGGDQVAAITQDFGSEVTLPTTVKDGYNFNGWYSDKDLTTLVESLVMPLDGITLYAGWVKASLSSVVTFNTNEGTPSTFTVTVTNGQPVAEPEEPTKKGFTFDGWFSDELLTVPYVFDTSVTTDITLYAKWQAKPTLLYSYNFLDGGSNNNSAYATKGLTTNVSYASDNPGGTSGTTSWKADYANLNGSSWTRLGGKLVSTEFGSPNANIRTNFTFSETLTKVEITGASTFGTTSNLGNIYLQTSTDGTTWTTVSTKTVASTIIFDGLNISSGSYIRIAIALTASTKNSGLQFTGIKVTGTK